MIFHPQHLISDDGSFVFRGQVHATAHPCFHKDIFQTLWQGFTYRSSTLHLTETDKLLFQIGDAEPLPTGGHAYSIHVTEGGVCIRAETEGDLIRGWMTWLDRLRAEESDGALSLATDCCRITDSPLIENRMIHFCVFPETELWELQRFVRLCGALKYSHIILEFWGMLRYDCMKELSWSHAFTKEQVRPILREASDLGMEIIPMFNHWGHASAARVMHGKHVVLDQDPSLQSYFSEDGWCWDIRKPKVRSLLRQIRAELTELFGDGHYFHIGCDEAYHFSFTDENMDFLCDFINEISREMGECGRRVITWGDMFLYRHDRYNKENRYACNAPSPHVETYMLERLSREVLFADWQYNVTHAPVETAFVFREAGFDCLLCPWDRGKEQLGSCIATVKENRLSGLLHTTWHTLSLGMPYVTMAAVGCFEDGEEYSSRAARTHTAALLRKVYFVNGDYKRSGWSTRDVGEIT